MECSNNTQRLRLPGFLFGLIYISVFTGGFGVF